MVHFAGQIEASGLKLCQEWVRNNADPALVEPQNRGKLQLDLASLGKLVEDGIHRGELKQDTPADMLARTLADVLYGQMLCWAMAGGAYSYKARTEEFCRFCLPALINPYLVKKKERNN